MIRNDLGARQNSEPVAANRLPSRRTAASLGRFSFSRVNMLQCVIEAGDSSGTRGK